MQRRTITAAALAIPLATAMALPATAAPPSSTTISTMWVEASNYVWATSDQLPGNVHHVHVSAGEHNGAPDASINITSHQCDPGELPWSEGDEDATCDLLASYHLYEERDVLTRNARGTEAVISGTFVLTPFESDEAPVTVSVDVTATTPTVTLKQRNRDRGVGEDGRRYRATTTWLERSGEATGTVGDLDMSGSTAYTGEWTHTVRSYGPVKR